MVASAVLIIGALSFGCVPFVSDAEAGYSVTYDISNGCHISPLFDHVDANSVVYYTVESAPGDEYLEVLVTDANGNIVNKMIFSDVHDGRVIGVLSVYFDRDLDITLQSQSSAGLTSDAPGENYGLIVWMLPLLVLVTFLVILRPNKRPFTSS